MVRHLIYIYKVPASTRRIGYVYSSNNPIYHKDIPKKLIELSENYELAIHRIYTDDFSVESIKNKDEFFESIEFLSDLDVFSSELDGAIIEFESIIEELKEKSESIFDNNVDISFDLIDESDVLNVKLLLSEDDYSDLSKISELDEWWFSQDTSYYILTYERG